MDGHSLYYNAKEKSEASPRCLRLSMNKDGCKIIIHGATDGVGSSHSL